MNFPLLSAQLGTAQLGKAQLGQVMVQLPAQTPNRPIDAKALIAMKLPNFYSWILKRNQRRNDVNKPS